MRHPCHAIGCDTEVPPKLFMCRPHWIKLPKHLQKKIWDNYKEGQEITKTPTKLYIYWACVARIWMARKEKQLVDPKITTFVAAFEKDNQKSSWKRNLFWATTKSPNSDFDYAIETCYF